MSCLLSGVTMFVSTDNKLFAFTTECIAKSPLSAFIPYYIDSTITNDINVIKLSLFSSLIQTYILLATGIRIFPMSNDCTSQNENVYHINYSSGHLEIITLNTTNTQDDEMLDIDDISKLIDDYTYFQDIDEFVQNSMANFNYI